MIWGTINNPQVLIEIQWSRNWGIHQEPRLVTISYERHMCIFLTQNLTVQITTMGIKEAYSHGLNLGAMSLSPREWSIWAGEKAMSYIQAVRNLETIQPVRVSPNSDVGVIWRPTCEEFTVGWVLGWGIPANMLLIVKMDGIKLGSVVIPRITCGGTRNEMMKVKPSGARSIFQLLPKSKE